VSLSSEMWRHVVIETYERFEGIFVREVATSDMAAVGSSVTLVPVDTTTRHRVPEDISLHSHRHENLKSQNISPLGAIITSRPESIPAHPACTLKRILDKSNREKREIAVFWNVMPWRLKATNASEETAASNFTIEVCNCIPRNVRIFLPN
jgi:hypothetical protein